MKRLVEILILVGLQIHVFSQNTSTELTLGDKILRTIKIGESHAFQLKLEQAQFALLNLKQIGIDVRIETFSPQGLKIEEFDSPNGNDGNEIILLDAQTSGTYVIKVNPLGEIKKQKKGDYEIILISIKNNVKSHLDEVLLSLSSRNQIPGFGVGLVNYEKVLYQNAFGFSNLTSNTPFTVETVQNIASVSKTFISLSLMKLVDEKKLSLDTPINDILPFEVFNPYYPKVPISIRHLATHTSSINEKNFYHKGWIVLDTAALRKHEYHEYFLQELDRAKENQKMSLAEFLESHLSPNGKEYSKKNFFRARPGKNWYYSNVGAALAAYIVELRSGVPYKEYVRKNILEPLNLESATWSGNAKEKFSVATQYDSKGNPLPSRTTITYPDGGMYMNVSDLGKYLMAFMKGNSGEDDIISASAFQELMKVQHEQKKGKFKGRQVGLYWEYSKSGVMGHSGGDAGVSARMYFDPRTNLGFVKICNIMPLESDYSHAQSRSIWSVLKRYAAYFDDAKS